MRRCRVLQRWTLQAGCRQWAGALPQVPQSECPGSPRPPCCSSAPLCEPHCAGLLRGCQAPQLRRQPLAAAGMRACVRGSQLLCPGMRSRERPGAPWAGGARRRGSARTRIPAESPVSALRPHQWILAQNRTLQVQVLPPEAWASGRSCFCRSLVVSCAWPRVAGLQTRCVRFVPSLSSPALL